MVTSVGDAGDRRQESHDMPVIASWSRILEAAGSSIFRGTTADRQHDRASGTDLGLTDAACFTQSNGRLLIGQGADGAFTFASLPVDIFPVPSAEREFWLGPGNWYRSTAPLYIGELRYSLELDGEERPRSVSGADSDATTRYADHWIPLSTTSAGLLEASVLSVAPVASEARPAALSPAPLPGPAGALYVVHLRNVGSSPVAGTVVLQASDRLMGDIEDASPRLARLKHPAVDVRQETLILSRPEGSVGIHLHEGTWRRLEAPFEAGTAFRLDPGRETVVVTHVAMGSRHGDVLPTIYELHRREPLDWFASTLAHWRSRLGTLTVTAHDRQDLADLTRDVFIRSMFDNLNCVQVDERGHLVAHSQGGPSEPYGLMWGIDVEPTATSLLGLCPEIAWEVLRFFASRSRAPKGPLDHSVPILVAPLIIARQWLLATGDLDAFHRHPEVVKALDGIVADLVALRTPDGLVPSRYASDGPVGRRYDYGTMIKVVAGLEGHAALLRLLGRGDEAGPLVAFASEARSAIERTMIADGPFGPQISGGTNLGEPPGTFYLPEEVLYYDGEDTSTMLAPLYGACSDDDPAWLNAHRFARSLWCPNYDPEFDTLRWTAGEIAVIDGTSFFSRIAGCQTPEEIWEAVDVLRDVGVDDVTGSVFWWPHGREYKRAMTRCSQGQGAWVWHFVERWLGIRVDALERIVYLDPRGPLDAMEWTGFVMGGHRFDVAWRRQAGSVAARVTAHDAEPWEVRLGNVQAHARPGMPVELREQRRDDSRVGAGMTRSTLVDHEVRAFGSGGVLFRRFGSAVLWGHWDRDRRWERGAMPFSLRFVIGNGTSMHWTDVSVTVDLPSGWRGQGRQPRTWPRPDQPTPGRVQVALGSLGRSERSVAPFWLVGPRPYAVESAGRDRTTSFHADRQPGPGLTVRAPDVDAPETHHVVATLRARAEDGTIVERRLDVPIALLPGSAGPALAVP
jgi:hypothetical protein